MPSEVAGDEADYRDAATHFNDVLGCRHASQERDAVVSLVGDGD